MADLITWCKSSYSTTNGDCVEVGWRKSSYSANGGNCVEVGRDARTVLVRDTKDRSGGTLDFPATPWRSLLTHLG